MKPYIYAQKNGTYLIDLDKTVEAMEKAVTFLETVKKNNGQVLVVGTKPQTSFVIKKMLTDQDKVHYVDAKWSPGLITNWGEIKERVNQYKTLKQQFETDEIMKYTKKEVAVFRKELDKLDRTYHGVAGLKKRPDVLIALDAVGNRNAILEAHKAGIPVIAIVDVNANPDKITYPIPANDDSVKSVEYILKKLVSVIS